MQTDSGAVRPATAADKVAIPAAERAVPARAEPERVMSVVPVHETLAGAALVHVTWAARATVVLRAIAAGPMPAPAIAPAAEATKAP
jgi:hypothetical protein